MEEEKFQRLHKEEENEFREKQNQQEPKESGYLPEEINYIPRDQQRERKSSLISKLPSRRYFLEAGIIAALIIFPYIRGRYNGRMENLSELRSLEQSGAIHVYTKEEIKSTDKKLENTRTKYFTNGR